MYDYLIVGAGFAGSVSAERLASQLNKKVLIVEKRNHIGGNAYDEYDEHGILVHRYGPHIFHTNNKEVFEYLSKFTGWRFYEHKVMARIGNNDYPIPINRLTLNLLYDLNLQTEEEVAEFYNRIRENRYPILNSEDVIVSKVGRDLFEKFYSEYTKKQWGLEARELGPGVCGRIPVRTNDDCRYFDDKYQYMPLEGYTKLFERMLNHKNIEIILNTDYKEIIKDTKFDKLIYTGPIDYFFDYEYGHLPYRSLRFEYQTFQTDYVQKCAQINYVKGFDFTRVVEHKHLSGQSSDYSTISKEYPIVEGDPFYPIPNDLNHNQYIKYYEKAVKLKSCHFLGRLAEYKYYNMDQIIANILDKLQDI